MYTEMSLSFWKNCDVANYVKLVLTGMTTNHWVCSNWQIPRCIKKLCYSSLCSFITHWPVLIPVSVLICEASELLFVKYLACLRFWSNREAVIYKKIKVFELDRPRRSAYSSCTLELVSCCESVADSAASSGLFVLL